MTNSSDPKRTNGLGVAALVISLISLLFAFIPIINFFVPFLAIIGLILGVVGLSIKNLRKGMASAGAIVSALALVISISVASFYADSLRTSIAPDLEIVDDTSESSQSDPQEEEPEAQEQGTRENPLPLGTTIRLGDEWEIEVGPSILNANKVIKAENRFNDPAPEGYQYAILTLKFTYIGEASGTPWTSVTVNYISTGGNTHTSSDYSVVVPDDLFSINELFPGASGTGNVAIAIPKEDAENGVWRVEPWLWGDGFFFSAK